MAGNKILHRVRTELVGTQSGNCGNKSINHHRAASRRTANECSAHGSNIKTAHLSQYIDHIILVRIIDGNSILDDLLLFQEALIRNTAPATGHRLHIRLQKNRQDSRGGGGVADAHFTNADDIRLGILRQFKAHINGLFALFPAHGRAKDNVLRAVGDLFVQHLRFPDICIDAHIADGNFTTKVLTEGRCTSLMPGQVDGLHQCH